MPQHCCSPSSDVSSTSAFKPLSNPGPVGRASRLPSPEDRACCKTQPRGEVPMETTPCSCPPSPGAETTLAGFRRSGCKQAIFWAGGPRRGPQAPGSVPAGCPPPRLLRAARMRGQGEAGRCLRGACRPHRLRRSCNSAGGARHFVALVG